MKQALSAPVEAAVADDPAGIWLSTNYRHMPVSRKTASRVARLGDICNKIMPSRLGRQVWIRYRIDLTRYPASAAATPAELTPITPTFIETLSQPPLRDQPPARTAIRLWQHGLRGGHVWIKEGRPLCLQWLFSHRDNPLLQRLPDWSGMYPPLSQRCGQVENILTLPAGMRYPGGAAGPFTLAMYRLAASLGMHWLITHIHERNTAAHRWAQRTGWTAYGHIHRFQPDIPLLRQRYLYLHDISKPKVELSVARPFSSSSEWQGIQGNGHQAGADRL